MGTRLGLNMKQLLFVLIVVLTLLITTVIVIHAASPHLFHELALRPNVFDIVAKQVPTRYLPIRIGRVE